MAANFQIAVDSYVIEVQYPGEFEQASNVMESYPLFTKTARSVMRKCLETLVTEYIAKVGTNSGTVTKCD